MIHTYDNGNDFRSPATRPDRSAVSGILVTPNDLCDTQKLSSSGSKSLYVKPLVSDHREVWISSPETRDSTGQQSRRMPKVEYTTRSSLAEDSVLRIEQHNPYHRQNPNETSRNNARMGSPALARLNRTSFKRDSAVRRSLGGMAIPPSWLNDDPTLPFERASRINTDRASPTPSPHPSVPSKQSHSTLDLAPLLHIRVVRLPSLDDLGFALDSYSHPQTGQFLGLRLCDRFQNRKFHFDARDNCPFEPGDLIVSVNQHRLSSMHESQAIRYVYNAFRDARQYTVEFGVFRLPPARDEISENRVTSKPYYEPSTLPTRSSRTKRYSAAYLMEPITTSDPAVIEVNQHQPRRVVVPKSTVTPESHFYSSSPHRPERLEISPSYPSTIKASPDTPTLSANRLSSAVPDSTSSSYKGERFGKPGKPVQLEGESPTRLSVGFRSSARARTGMQGRSFSPGSPNIYRRSFSGTALKDLNAFNTRTIGQKILIRLTKLADGGLGFTLTRRDTQTNSLGNDPVYVKKILPIGAAIQDGRLLVGDRLLTVDDVDVCNLDQVLSQLRSVLPGQCVNLVVSRQASALSDESFSGRKSALPSISQSPEEPDLNSVDLPPRPYRSYTYEFRLPSTSTEDSQKPTLGVNFKWCTAPPNCDESQSRTYAPLPGLYVESLLPDGIVMQSERRTLQPGDRLVGLNGDSLEGLGAKEISLKIKRVLAGSEDLRMERPPAGTALPSGRFSLTVHRYRGLQRRSFMRNRTSIVIEDARGSVLPTTSDYANGPLLTDTRHRRSWFQDNAQDPSGSIGEGMRYGGNSPRHLSVPPRILGGSNPYFEREGFGRRSVSEKRHGHVDASQYPFFQSQILPSRYKMPEDVDKQYSTMPTTRRLKIQRERMAANAAANLVGTTGGPVKALHPSDSGRPSDPGIYALQSNQSSLDHSNRDESTSTRDPSASLFRRGRKQNNSFRNAVDRSLTLNSNAAVLVSEEDHPSARSRSATRVPSNQVVTPSSISSAPLKTFADSTRLPPTSVNDTANPHFLTNHTSPVQMKAAIPQLPARMHTAESVKPPKRNFGGIRGLFKFVSGKSSQIDKSIDDRSSKLILAPPQRRLSVPECQAPSSNANHTTTASQIPRNATSSSLHTSSKPSPMQIPFRDTYYVLRSPTKSNEAFVAESSSVPRRSSNSLSGTKRVQTHSHITPQSQHRVVECQTNLPVSPQFDNNVSTPPVPPRPHRSIPKAPIGPLPKSTRSRESTTPKHNGYKSSSGHDHRPGRSNPESSRLSGTYPTQISADARAFSQTVSAYPNPVLLEKQRQSMNVSHAGPSQSHRSPKHTVPVSHPDSDRIYENNRLQHVTQRKPDYHSTRSHTDSTKHPTSPSKRPHSAVPSPVVVAKPLASTPSHSAAPSTHASSRSKRRTADLNLDSTPRTSALSPSDGRQSNQFISTKHRQRKSPGRSGH